MEKELGQIIDLLSGKGLWFFALYILYKNVWSITLLCVTVRSGRLVINRILDFIREFKEKQIEQQKVICSMKEELIIEVRREFEKEISRLCEQEKKL